MLCSIIEQSMPSYVLTVYLKTEELQCSNDIVHTEIKLMGRGSSTCLSFCAEESNQIAC